MRRETHVIDVPVDGWPNALCFMLTAEVEEQADGGIVATFYAWMGDYAFWEDSTDFPAIDFDDDSAIDAAIRAHRDTFLDEASERMVYLCAK